MVERSKNWENERYIFEKLKQTKVFRDWKKAQFDCQHGQCAWCKKPMQYRYTETDHIKPLYYGGNSEATNLVICHHSCNKNKSTASGFERPDWVRKNTYDDAVTRKYHSLLDELINEDGKYDDEQIKNVEPHLTIGRNEKDYSYGIDDAIRAEQIIKTVPRPMKESRKVKRDGMIYVLRTLMALVLIIIIILLPILMNSNNKRNGQSGSSSSSGKKSNDSTVVNEDSIRKTYTQSILDEYSKYYDYWVVKQGYSLPHDASKCETWNGCNLSFPLGNAKVPDGYTYSINSIESGYTFQQNGQEPHASTNNIALYKRARCGINGAVIGGNEGRNAAVVVQLSDKTYYCLQN